MCGQRARRCASVESAPHKCEQKARLPTFVDKGQRCLQAWKAPFVSVESVVRSVESAVCECVALKDRLQRAPFASSSRERGKEGTKWAL